MRIDNTAVIQWLASVYTLASAAQCYIVGFPIDNTVYYAEMPLSVILSDFVGISMTSDETPVKRLRIKPLTKKTLILFRGYNPKMLCSFDELQEIAKKQFSSNCGQAFESLICQEYGGKLAAANSAFWQCGDFSANSIEYQVKFQLATIITEYTAKQAEKETAINV